jgi:hypothetical protein
MFYRPFPATEVAMAVARRVSHGVTIASLCECAIAADLPHAKADFVDLVLKNA